MKKQLLFFTLSAGLGLIVAGIVSGYIIYNRMVVTPNKPKMAIGQPEPTATPTPDPLAPYSILLMGYGGGAHQGGLLTDSMMVAKVEPHNNKVTLISIPRDLWVPIPINGDETKSSKINAAYAIGADDRKYPNKKVEFTGKAGGGELSKYVVGQVVGFKIDYFVALDFQGFTKFIDILGGVDVNVQKTFDDPLYPNESSVGIGDSDNCGKSEADVAALTATMSGDKLEQQFPCRYTPLHFNKGLQHMDGLTALKYARSRHSPTDGGDFNRAARQRQVVLAVKQKVISLGFVSKIIPTIKTLSYNVTTDISFNQMEDFVSKAPVLESYTITSEALTDKDVLMDAKSADGQYILSPRIGVDDWSEVQKYVADPSSVIIATPTPTKAPKVKKTAVSVTPLPVPDQ